MMSLSVPPDLETGVPEIDQQHAKFLDLTNRVLASDPRALDPAPMLRELAALVDYVDYHFASEEFQMRACAYPATRLHIEHHARLRQSLAQIDELSKLPGSARAVAVRLRLLVQEWFVDHIRRMDIDFALFLQTAASPPTPWPSREALRQCGALQPRC